MTWLGVLNFLVLQWFGVRLARTTVPVLIAGRARRAIAEGELVIREDIIGWRALAMWQVMRWIWPLTGWWSEYRYLRPRYWRWLQLITNVHRIHHDRWSYGYTFRPIPWGYFPAFTTRQGEVIHYGWRRIRPTQFHDCTATGRY